PPSTVPNIQQQVAPQNGVVDHILFHIFSNKRLILWLAKDEFMDDNEDSIQSVIGGVSRKKSSIMSLISVDGCK
ncbi:hypothetical protein Leryth_011361, partial [Lithospermum erythrorhizon]